jgi:hypothetical protein
VEPGVGLDERELEQQHRCEHQIRAVAGVFGSRHRGEMGQLPEPAKSSWTDGASPSSGSRARTSHPSPIGPAAAVLPSSSARSRIERSPTPGVHELGGRPSSRTVTASVPLAVILTRQRRPSECVNALLMASLAMRYAASSTAGDKAGS